MFFSFLNGFWKFLRAFGGVQGLLSTDFLKAPPSKRALFELCCFDFRS